MGVRRYGFHGLPCSPSSLGSRSGPGGHRPPRQRLQRHRGGRRAVSSHDNVTDTDGRNPCRRLAAETLTRRSCCSCWHIPTGTPMVPEHAHPPQRNRRPFPWHCRHARPVSARADSRVDLAIRALTRSVAMAIASCATALDEWHALVFTGGIGEHSSEIREKSRAVVVSLPGAVADSRSTSASASDQLAARRHPGL